MLSDGFTYTTQHPTGTGKGDVIILEITSPTTDLEPGTYTYVGSDNNNKPFDFWNSLILLDYSTTTTNTGEAYEFLTGKIVVTKSGDTYTIDFDGTVALGGASTSKPIKGHYVGKLEAYEE